VLSVRWVCLEETWIEDGFTLALVSRVGWSGLARSGGEVTEGCRTKEEKRSFGPTQFLQYGL